MSLNSVAQYLPELDPNPGWKTLGSHQSYRLAPGGSLHYPSAHRLCYCHHCKEWGDRSLRHWQDESLERSGLFTESQECFGQSEKSTVTCRKASGPLHRALPLLELSPTFL